MAINYTQAFNAGEVSRKMDGRSDLEVYKTGCRDLDNFFVLPQGGVERRSGTEFIQFAGTDGTNPARMIEFDFSSDIRFVIELGTNYAKVHYTDSNGVDQVVDVSETDDIDYTVAELRQIQFNRKYDTLILTCPTKETKILTRDTITPTFSIKDIAYIYPPLQEKNITSTTIDPSLPTDIYSGTTTLTASADLFDAGHVGSFWAIDHIRAADKKEIADTRTANGEDAASDPLDVSFSNWSFETDGTWEASVVIQRRIDGGSWVNYIVIGDTRGGVQRNFRYASDTAEGANTELRVKWILQTSTQDFQFSIEAENVYHKGLVKINTVTNATTATATVVSMIQGGNFDSGGTAQDPDATLHWSEGAFSTYRGFSPASEFFENRLWMAGSKDQPADIFASVFGEIFNFLSGTLSTDAIKRTIDSPEEPKWLESKRYLFLGTAGTAVSIRSADRDSLITQNNITTLVENAYGSAALQAEVANDVIVYVQRDGLKLRELVYAQGEDTFIGNDLNLISEDVTNSGIVEMFVQKQPNQFIWCIKKNGDICVLTYERGQQVRGWARIDTDGEYYSAASIHDGGEDTVWACVKRDSKYCIEKFHPRKDLDWYVDSGKRLDGGASKTASYDLDSSKHVVVTSASHGYANDSIIKFVGKPNAYKVSDTTTNTFKLKQPTTTDYIIYSPVVNDQFDIVDTGGTTTLFDAGLTGTYKYDGTGWRHTTNSNAYFEAQFESDSTNQWLFYGSTSTAETGSFADTANFANTELPYVAPWKASWNAFQAGITYTFSASNFTNILTNRFSTSINRVYNEITGLNHIEGKTVQVVGDDNFIEEATVANNTITTDQYYNKLLVGLPYTSTLRPMPIEPSLVNKLSQSRVKATSKIIVRFFETKGAKVGEAGRQLTTFPVVDTQDPSGEAVSLKTGQQRFFVGSDYEREKLIEVRQDLPYPMTVLSIASHVNAEGA